MKYFFLLIIPVLLISCKKDNPLPPPEPVDYYLSHSGFIDGVPYTMGTNVVTTAIFDSGNIDEDLYRYVGFEVWASGDYFDVDSVVETTYGFGMEVVVQYSFSDLNGDGDMPELTAPKLAHAINSNSYDWNDDEEMKEIFFVKRYPNYSTALVGGVNFVITNPQIHATVVGANLIRIEGSVDSLSIELGPDPKYATNVHFDYVIPVPQ